MNIMQELEKSLKSDAPAYIEFLYRYNPKKYQIFAFYEGDEDSSFYRQYLERCVDADCTIEEIVAGCKNNVLKLQREFDWNIYNCHQIAFFVDRDLSDWLSTPAINENNIYITDGYSVENFLIKQQVFRLLLTQIKGFARAPKQDIDKMCECFYRLLLVFEDKLMPIMAMAVIAKGRNHDVSLNKYKISSHISYNIEDGQMSLHLDDDKELKEKWGITDITNEQINRQVNIFREHRKQYSVRGKWILYFMVELSEYMRRNFAYFSPTIARDKDKLHATCNIDSSKALPVLAPRCNRYMPKSLELFLARTYECYSNSCKHEIAN